MKRLVLIVLAMVAVGGGLWLVQPESESPSQQVGVPTPVPTTIAWGDAQPVELLCSLGNPPPTPCPYAD
jgi:hypothetical protein